MLDVVEASHFSPLTEKACILDLGAGKVLQVIVDSVVDKPRSRNPYAPQTRRMPFSVFLSAHGGSDFIEGPCTIDLGEFGRLEGVYVSRVAALGRDPGNAYYQIVFN